MAMTIVEITRPVTGGVDTHADVHVAAAVDGNGGVLGVESFATTPPGFRELHGWLARFGVVDRVGVEGAGAYGAGLARHLRGRGLVVIEVDRPNRQERRRNGKSDELDAIEAARAALSGRASGIAKSADGDVEAIRALLVARRRAPRLLKVYGVGTHTAAILLVAAGDNPHRLKNEAAFAHLCGVAPLPASSGKVTRHRLNPGGNRQANHALWRIVFTRMSSDERTRKYVARRVAEGKTIREIMRVLKRYVARELYPHLLRD